MAPNDLQELTRLYSRLRARRSQWDRVWQEIADYMVPWRASITTHFTPGAKTTDRIFDSTAPQALTLAASAVHGSVTPSTLRWFSFGFNDPELMDAEGVAPWVDLVSDLVFEAISSSNFDSEAQELYSDLLAFGTGCMVVEEEEARPGVAFPGLIFHAQQPGTFVIQEGPQGRVDTVMREVPMTLSALCKRWGMAKISERSQKLLAQNKGDQMVTVLHVICPRQDYTRGSKAPSKQLVASKWIELGESPMTTGQSQAEGCQPHLLKDDGRPEMPVMVPRWRKMSGEEYGRSPGMVVLPDVRTINQAVELRLKAWTLAVAPPIIAPDRGVIGSVRLQPFGLTYVRPGTKIEPLLSGTNFDVANFQEEQLRTTIKAGFFVDLLNFQAKPGTPISATEASIRFQTMQRILGPVVSRLQSEFLAPLVRRVLGIMARRGVLPPPPEALAQFNPTLQLNFEGPLARVQKAGDIEAINQFFSLLFPVSEVDKRPLARVNMDEVVEGIAAATSLPARFLRSREATDQIQAAEQEALQQQQQQAQLLEAAKVLQKSPGGMSAQTPVV